MPRPLGPPRRAVAPPGARRTREALSRYPLKRPFSASAIARGPAASSPRRATGPVVRIGPPRIGTAADFRADPAAGPTLGRDTTTPDSAASSARIRLGSGGETSTSMRTSGTTLFGSAIRQGCVSRMIQRIASLRPQVRGRLGVARMNQHLPVTIRQASQVAATLRRAPGPFRLDSAAMTIRPTDSSTRLCARCCTWGASRCAGERCRGGRATHAGSTASVKKGAGRSTDVTRVRGVVGAAKGQWLHSTSLTSSFAGPHAYWTRQPMRSERSTFGQEPMSSGSPKLCRESRTFNLRSSRSDPIWSHRSCGTPSPSFG
jgi:hypothetical protein